MYTDRDYADCERRVRRCALALGLCAALFLGLFIAALKLRIRPMAVASGLALFLSATFVTIYYLIPNVRYRTFLQDIAQGLISEMAGSVVSIADGVQPQDGALVLPVHLLLADQNDERIVYLNASKREEFPGVGANVRLKLCGRHIVEVAGGEGR